MEKTPYAYDFLWNQVELGFTEIRKKKYRELVEKYLFDEEKRKKLEVLKDKKGRNYKGGLLERTASIISLVLCSYDNYPEIDVDLLLTAVIMSGFCSIYPKKECFEKIKDYPEIIPFLFKKKRKKPSVEIYIFDSLIKIDNGIFLRLQKHRKNKEKK